MKVLEHKVALVTGGTSGIGKATVLAMGVAGAKVLFSGRREAEGEDTANLIRSSGAECLFVKSDVSNETDVQTLIQKTVETYGRLDVAFNNASIASQIKQLHKHSIAHFDRLMAINVRGLFVCMEYEIQQMLAQGAGVIINNSSIGGMIALAGISPYIASKYAVMRSTRTAAIDYAKQGIRINAVNPGFAATETIDRFINKDPAIEQQLASMAPMGLIGKPVEIAATVVFLCSDAASYMTGESLVVDGGYTAM